MTFSLCLKGVQTSNDSFAHKLLPVRHIETFPFQPLSRSKCWKEDCRKDKKTREESSSTIYLFYVLFYDASIVIGPNEMIGKECSFVNFSVRLLEISTVRGP